MNLFQLGDFTLHSGKKSFYKIDCDALTREDWIALAEIASRILPPFSSVEGVPQGGLPFADALRPYVQDEGPVLIVDDVLTTGGSMTKRRGERGGDKEGVLGCVVFSRTPIVPIWITPIFRMPFFRTPFSSVERVDP